MATPSAPGIVRTPASLIAQAVLRAVEVMGSAEDAQSWLVQPLPVLQGKTPLSLLDTAEFTKFEELLSHIEHGTFA
jgi:uncharacterized protein (DUF2384 family)